MPDVDKLFEKAEKYRQKQKFDSALETYLEINKLHKVKETEKAGAKPSPSKKS